MGVSWSHCPLPSPPPLRGRGGQLSLSRAAGEGGTHAQAWEGGGNHPRHPPSCPLDPSDAADEEDNRNHR
ncbi:hypothetical protein GAY33_36260, partial [Azospirillum brasilense]|nr:hypothetical protein [Azospirillum argentinense]